MKFHKMGVANCSVDEAKTKIKCIKINLLLRNEYLLPLYSNLSKKARSMFTCTVYQMLYMVYGQNTNAKNKNNS